MINHKIFCKSGPWIDWSNRQWVAVASAGQCASLHLTPDTSSLNFLHTWCLPDAQPTVSKHWRHYTMYCARTRVRARTHTHTHAHAHPHTRLTALFLGLPRWAGTRKIKLIWILQKQETVSGSGISWAICMSAPCSRQITTPAPHHSVFYRPDALPVAQPTASEHWRDNCYLLLTYLYLDMPRCMQSVFSVLFTMWHEQACSVSSFQSTSRSVHLFYTVTRHIWTKWLMCSLT